MKILNFWVQNLCGKITSLADFSIKISEEEKELIKTLLAVELLILNMPTAFYLLFHKKERWKCIKDQVKNNNPQQRDTKMCAISMSVEIFLHMRKCFLKLNSTLLDFPPSTLWWQAIEWKNLTVQNFWQIAIFIKNDFENKLKGLQHGLNSIIFFEKLFIIFKSKKF